MVHWFGDGWLVLGGGSGGDGGGGGGGAFTKCNFRKIKEGVAGALTMYPNKSVELDIDPMVACIIYIYTYIGVAVSF